MAAEREDIFDSFQRRAGPSVAGQLSATPVSEWLSALRIRLSGSFTPIPAADTPFEYAVRAAQELVCGDWGGAVEDLQRSNLTPEERASLLHQAGSLTSTLAAMMTQEQRSAYFTMTGLENGLCMPRDLETIEECGGIVFVGPQPCLGFRPFPLYNKMVIKSLVDVGLVLSAARTSSAKARFDMLPTTLCNGDYIAEQFAQGKLSYSRLRGYVRELHGAAQLITQNRSHGHMVRAICVAPLGSLGARPVDIVEYIGLERSMVWLTRFDAWDQDTPLLTAQLTKEEVATLQVQVSTLPMCDPTSGETELVSSYERPGTQKEQEALVDVSRFNYAKAVLRAGLPIGEPSDAVADARYRAVFEEMKAQGELVVAPPTVNLPSGIGTTFGTFLGQDRKNENLFRVTNYMCQGSSNGVLLQSLQGSKCCVGFSFGKEMYENHNLCIRALLVQQDEKVEHIEAAAPAAPQDELPGCMLFECTQGSKNPDLA